MIIQASQTAGTVLSNSRDGSFLFEKQQSRALKAVTSSGCLYLL